MHQEPLTTLLENQAEFAWFLGNGKSIAPEVRRELLTTIHESIPVAILAAVLTTTIAMIAWLVTEQSWSLVWWGAECVILTNRLLLLRQHHSLGENIEHPSFLWLNRINSIWFTTLGLGVLGCLLSADPLLIVLATSLIFGIIGALASRLAAAPRLALLLKILLITPSFAALWVSPSLWLSGLLISAVLYCVIMQLLTAQNHRLLHDKIAANHTNSALLGRDPLTGLSNRRELRSTLHKLGTQSKPSSLCVMYLDLDGFKAVNDNFGHPAGDHLLIEVSHRLTHLVRDTDLVCRLGGDEFVILLQGASHADAERKAKLIITGLSHPIPLSPEVDARIGVSIGIALSPEHSQNPEELVTLADQALYLAKADGKGIYKFCCQPKVPHHVQAPGRPK